MRVKLSLSFVVYLSVGALFAFVLLMPWTGIETGAQSEVLVSEAQDSAIDGNGSRLFLLHKDSTVSVYDVAQKQFLVLRKPVPGLANLIDITVDKGGKWFALVNGGIGINDPATLVLLPIRSLLEAGQEHSEEAPSVNLGVIREAASAFSPSGRLFVITNTAQGRAYIFNLETGDQFEVATGKSPSALAFDTLEQKVFILNQGSNNVSIINLTKREVVATIVVGLQPSGVLFNRNTKRVFVSNAAAGTVSVINPETLRVEGEVRVGSQPGSLDFDTENGFVFVANNGDGTVSIISPDLTVRTLNLQAPAYFPEVPIMLAFSENSRRLFVLNQTTTQYFIYDVNTAKIIKEGSVDARPLQLLGYDKSELIFVRHFAAPVRVVNLRTLEVQKIEWPGLAKEMQSFLSFPLSIAVDEDANKIYVSNLGSHSITVIDGKSQKPVTVIPISKSPQVIALNPKTKKLYASSPIDNTVTIIDTTKSSYPAKTITVGNGPRSIAVNGATNKVYISNSGEGSVSVIDGERDVVIKKIDLSPEGIFPLVSIVNEAKNEVYIANYGGDSVAVIDGNTDAVKRFIKVGRNPIWVRYIPEINQLYVNVEGKKKVIRINPGTYEVAESFELDKIPYRIFFDLETQLIYINHRRDETVTVIKPSETQIGKGTIIATTQIPYYGQTDTIYNMVGVNYKTGLRYFTYGARDQVIVVKVERVGDMQLLRPIWFATISKDGLVQFNPQFQVSQVKPLRQPGILSWKGYVVVGIFLVLLAGGLTVFFHRRAATRSST